MGWRNIPKFSRGNLERIFEKLIRSNLSSARGNIFRDYFASSNIFSVKQTLILIFYYMEHQGFYIRNII